MKGKFTILPTSQLPFGLPLFPQKPPFTFCLVGRALFYCIYHLEMETIAHRQKFMFLWDHLGKLKFIFK